MTAAAGGPGAAESPAGLTHKQILTILGGLMAGMFLAALDQTIVATSIRTIADDLGQLSGQAWATTAYLITSTITTPLYGKLSDIYGRRPLFLAAITIFVIGSVASGVRRLDDRARRVPGLQGLGAGGLFSLALAILGDIVPPRERVPVPGLLPGRVRHLVGARPDHRRLLRRRRHDPGHHRLALGLPDQRADRHRRAVRRDAGCCTSRTSAATTASTGGAPSRWSSAWCRCCSSPSRATSGAGSPPAAGPAT